MEHGTRRQYPYSARRVREADEMKEAKERVSEAIDNAKADLEQALYELEKLPAVSEESVGFATHALTNFLTVTTGVVDLLDLALRDHPSADVHRLVDTLRHSSDLMTHTVGQLRSASIRKDDDLVRDSIDLSAMARRFATFYQPVADRKRIRFVVEPCPVPPLAWTDRVMTAVVFDNLISNAVKYSTPGGQVRIECEVQEDGVVCHVRDEGPGLCCSDQAKLFQRGARLGPRPTGGEASTGYGLAVTKEFVDRLDGSIWCESAEGEGACFAFRLPRYRAELHGAAEQPSSGAVS